MIEKRDISDLVREYIRDTDFFVVDVRVSSTSRITVLFDKKSGGITVDDCVRLSKFIEGNLDRDKEDFELQVSSPGLEMPFLVYDQYVKNEGRAIEVIDTDGIKITGELVNVTKGGFELKTPSGEISVNFDNVKTAKVVIQFNKH